jgi:hypothetical protein
LPSVVWPRPVNRIASLGRNRSAWQSPTWKCCVAWWMAPEVETIVALICFGPHEVGLIVKPGRFTSTAIDRNLTGTPLTIVGSGSDTTVM